MKMSRSGVVGVTCMCFWMAASLASGAEVAGNRIANGEFDDLTTDPWVELFPEISEFQLDTLFEADGCTNSDAARAINTNPEDFGSTYFQTCTTDFTEGESLTLSGRFLFPNGTAESRAQASYGFYSGGDCTGYLDGNITPFAWSTDGTGVWYERALYEPFVVPKGTGSIAITITFTKIAGTDPVADVVFDAIRLLAADQIFVDGFELGETCRWSTVVPGP